MREPNRGGRLPFGVTVVAGALAVVFWIGAVLSRDSAASEILVLGLVLLLVIAAISLVLATTVLAFRYRNRYIAEREGAAIVVGGVSQTTMRAAIMELAPEVRAPIWFAWSIDDKLLRLWRDFIRPRALVAIEWSRIEDVVVIDMVSGGWPKPGIALVYQNSAQRRHSIPFLPQSDQHPLRAMSPEEVHRLANLLARYCRCPN